MIRCVLLIGAVCRLSLIFRRLFTMFRSCSVRLVCLMILSGCLLRLFRLKVGLVSNVRRRVVLVLSLLLSLLRLILRLVVRRKLFLTLRLVKVILTRLVTFMLLVWFVRLVLQLLCVTRSRVRKLSGILNRLLVVRLARRLLQLIRLA